MSVKAWAVKPGELKGLTRSELLLLAARSAMRVEKWIPDGAEKAWRDALQLVIDNAFAETPRATSRVSRDLGNRGAIACNDLEPVDEPLGQCVNHATSTLAAALDASALAMGPALKKSVIDAAKYSASIGAVLAHAGHVRGRDPVESAALAVWDSIRADIPAIAAASASIETAADRPRALRACNKLWLRTTPAWAR